MMKNYSNIFKLSICLYLVLTAAVAVGQRPESKLPDFTVKFKDEVIPYRIMGVSALPNETLQFEAIQDEPDDTYEVKVNNGVITKLGRSKWGYMTSDKKGLSRIVIKNIGANDSVVINCFVMIPYDEMVNERINNYRIGSYPYSSKEIYQKPRGFIEITKENEDTHVSPHLQLKDFKCKQAQGYPKYIVLRERLYLKLEMIIEQVQDAGYKCTDLVIMSGYRTPFYNKAIGNVKFSRHVFGDASDIYIDENKDGQMDDLNNDGSSDKKDARILYNLINKLKDNAWYQPFIGGLGLYGRTASHPAFVHVDVRGYIARWGQ